MRIDRERVEGVYVVQIEYAGQPLIQIERVNGDCSVSEFPITPAEARDLMEQLEGISE